MKNLWKKSMKIINLSVWLFGILYILVNKNWILRLRNKVYWKLIKKYIIYNLNNYNYRNFDNDEYFFSIQLSIYRLNKIQLN